MTIRATKFTPKVLLGAPRRGIAIPCSDGSLVLYTVSTYSFGSHSQASEIRTYDINTGESILVTDDPKAEEPNWLGNGKQILWLQKNGSGTDLMVRDPGRTNPCSRLIGTVPGPVSNVKLKQLSKNTIAIAVTGQASPDGKLHNPENDKVPHCTGKVYNSLFVRHWDSYNTSNRAVIWCGQLSRSPPTQCGYSLMEPGLFNILKDSKLECPTPPFSGINDYDLSEHGVLLVAKDPSLNQATTTKSDPYYVPVSYSGEKRPGKPQRIRVDALQGASSSPVFSPDGKQAVFLKMKDIAYESDKNRLILLPDITNLSTTVDMMRSADGKGSWSLSPNSIRWSNGGTHLYLTAEEKGRVKLFMLPSIATTDDPVPVPLTSNGHISAVKSLGNADRRLLVTSSTIIDDSVWSVVDPESPDSAVVISSNSRHGRLFGLKDEQVSEIWFDGSSRSKIHAWVVKPSNFDENKRYPLAYLIHGGPQGAWTDGWSTRWNLAVFAEQGYVVIAPNPTGSTGYGQDFVDAIQNNWGGRPYLDLVKGFRYIRKKMRYVDTKRAVALGASYGGYMVNWMQGLRLGREFKALVTHDGVFSTSNQYATDELWFPKHDFNGSVWNNKYNYRHWDPTRFLSEWQTPHMIIHSELDYRIPISEGLAAFNVLQDKGIKSKFLTFPNENHWVLKPENSLQWHVEVFNWINSFVDLPPYEVEA